MATSDNEQRDSDETEEVIRLMVRLLVTATRTRHKDLAEAIGLGTSELYRSLQESPNRRRKLTTSDVKKLAEHFEVPVGFFFQEPEAVEEVYERLGVTP